MSDEHFEECEELDDDELSVFINSIKLKGSTNSLPHDFHEKLMEEVRKRWPEIPKQEAIVRQESIYAIYVIQAVLKDNTLLQNLSKKHKDIIIYRYYQGKDIYEISKILRMSVPEVAGMLEDALSHLGHIVIPEYSVEEADEKD